jgi:hypothetical protein
MNNDLTPRVQVDGGADHSITPHRELMHGFRLPNPSKGDMTHINDAGVHPHLAKFLDMVIFVFVALISHRSRPPPVLINVPCAYIPSIPSTLLNFGTMEN